MLPLFGSVEYVADLLTNFVQFLLCNGGLDYGHCIQIPKSKKKGMANYLKTENDKLHQVKDVKNSQPAILKRQVKIKTWNVFYENLILTYQGFKTNLEK